MVFNKIKKLVEWMKSIWYFHTIIVDGKKCVIDKRIRDINVENQKISVGEIVTIYKKQWVKIVNMSPIKYSHKDRDELFTEEYLDRTQDECMSLNSRTIHAGDSCIIAPHGETGEIKVLGFTNSSYNNVKILVSYTSIGYHYETVCPDGAEFLLKPEEFIKMKKITQNK